MLFRRRQYCMKKNFQARFIVKFLIVSSMGSIFSIFLFYTLARQKIDSVLFSMTIPSGRMSELLFREAVYANITVVVFIALVFALTVRGIHDKIATSLHRLRVDLMRLINGDLSSRVSLSPQDEFKDFADELNLMTSELDHRLSEIKGICRRINASVGDLPWASAEESLALKEKISGDIGRLDEKLKGFNK